MEQYCVMCSQLIDNNLSQYCTLCNSHMCIFCHCDEYIHLFQSNLCYTCLPLKTTITEMSRKIQK